MSKKEKPCVFQNQLKTIHNIESKINELIQTYGALKGGIPRALFRVQIEPHTATLYNTDSIGKKKVHQGIKEGDYKFSQSDPFWIEASNYHGLSFSSTFNQTRFTLDLLGKFQRNKTRINVAYWILEDSKCIPEDMVFIQDPNNPEHYLLVVTKRMSITTLVQKLTWISQRMSVLNGLRLEVYKP